MRDGGVNEQKDEWTEERKKEGMKEGKCIIKEFKIARNLGKVYK